MESERHALLGQEHKHWNVWTWDRGLSLHDGTLCDIQGRGFPLQPSPGPGPVRPRQPSYPRRRLPRQPGRYKMPPFRQARRFAGRLPLIGPAIGLYGLIEWLPGIAPGYNLDGWQLQCGSGLTANAICIALGHPNGIGINWSGAYTGAHLCGITDSVSQGYWGMDVPSGIRTLVGGIAQQSGEPSCYVRHTIEQQWGWPGESAPPDIIWNPGRGPVPLYEPNPYLPPFAPVPEPYPYPVAPPVPTARPLPLRGYGPKALPRARERPLPQKAPPRVRERKVKGLKGRVLLALMGVLHTLTEIGDFVDAVAKGLSSADKRAYNEQSGLHEKFLFLMKNYDRIDYEVALDAVIENEIQDRILGKWFKAMAEAGIGMGVNGQPYLMREGQLDPRWGGL